jgi:methyl-accepting chemotaxis protein
MAKYINASIKRKLVILFLVVTLFPIALVGYLAYSRAQSALLQAQFEKLRVMRFEKEDGVARLLKQINGDLLFLAGTFRLRQALDALEASTAAASPSEASGGASEEAKAKGENMKKMFTAFLDLKGGEEGIEDLLLIGADDGQILFSQNKLEESATNVKTGALAGSGLYKVWEAVVQTKKPVMSDYSIYQLTGAPAAFLGAPVQSFRTGKLAGVLAIRINANPFTNTMKLNPGAGETTKAYLVGQDFLMRTGSRFEKASTVLRAKVETEGAREALEGKKGFRIYRDFRGAPVLGVYAPLGLGKIKTLTTNFKWGIVCEMDESEALKPAASLGFYLRVATLCIAVLAALLAVALARSVSRPISRLAGQMDEVGQGDLTVDVYGLNRGDEIGILSRSFARMMENLRTQVRSTLEGINTVASSASEISITVTQLAVSTTKTSAALTETTSTVEEVKQAGQLASDKARRVSEGAKHAVSVSEAGKKATEDTIEKMNLIKEQMESIGETVVRLSEQSKAIEDIISTVQDLADQSNLLAVNASIEAARAGEQGKGFAVVAQEIKSLADQSRGATDQVRAILEETRKWVSAVVMATEQGNRAVSAGVAQSGVASESIGTLARAVSHAAEAASVIDTSVQQQFVGVDQVSSAMTNIEESMHQNLTGTKRLEIAAKRLEDLGTSLKELAKQYKV